MTSTAGVETLHALRHPLVATRTAALTAGFAPPCAVALVIGWTSGHPLPAIALIALVLVCVVLTLGIALTSRITLVPGGLINRRIVDNAEVRTDQIAKGVLRRIQNFDEVGSQRHLFLLDAAGRTVFRLSNRWWTDAQIARIVNHLGVPVERSDEALHLAELRRVARDQLRWNERHPLLWTAAKAGVICVVSFVIALLATASL